jgi:protein SCO1/2
MPSRSKFIFALSVLSIALVTAMGTLWFSLGPRNPVTSSGTALIGGPFELTDHNGQRVTERDFLGKYMLIFFGFTYCPDVCPSELQVMSAALDELGSEADRVRPILITIDPERDTPDVMKQYVSNFHSSLIGLTGSPDDIRKVASAYRVYYARQPGKENDPDYTMDHSTILYLMGPDGKFLQHFTYGTDAKALALKLRDAISQ